MGIFHIVLFQFKSDTPIEVVKQMCERMLALKDQCVHPTTTKPYLLSVVGGKDNSPENLQNGITHGFIVEFANEEDRTYYINTDPSHRKFVSDIGAVVEKAQVVDFAPGAF